MNPTGTRRLRRVPTRWMLVGLLLAAALWIPSQAWNTSSKAQQDFVAAGVPGTFGLPLAPTVHPPVPATLDSMWYAPVTADRPVAAALANFARGVRLLEESGDAAAALPLVDAAQLASTDVADEARYYTGIAFQKLDRLELAEAAFAAVAARTIPGHLPEAAALGHAEVLEARGHFAGALAIYERLLERQGVPASVVWFRLGMAAEAAGDRARAVDAQRHVAYDFPLSSEAAEAALALKRLDGFVLDTPAAIAAELARAETQFRARRWALARPAYDRLRGRVDHADRDLVTLRLAELEAQSGKHRAALDVFHRFARHEVHGEEAEFYFLSSTRALGDHSGYRQMVRSFVAKYPSSPLAEEALNGLATHYVLVDQDDEAAETFVELLARFPSGRFAERAAWKAGWWAYRQRQFRDTVRIFEHGAATFPRSDYRPAWLYWTGRAYDQLAEAAAATDRYRLAATDYLNLYHGRLAWDRLQERNQASVTPAVRRMIVAPPTPPPTIDRIARLIALELYHPALHELQFAQRAWGDSPPLRATIAFVQYKLGNLRLGINAMKRAYPQYIAAGGENLPVEILRVLFPVDYWPLLQYHANARGLDPYLVAALVAQESTFDPVIRSSANAIGLMQILSSTGRRYARKLGIQPFSASRLTDPEINVRIGTTYLAELINRFGGAHFALASYNAGEHRVARWRDEQPGLPQDEFIEEIPFPETQNYVKRILGTAEDYRRLYLEGAAQPVITRSAPTAGSEKKATSNRIKKAPARKRAVRKPTVKKPAAKNRAAKNRSVFRKPG